MNGTPVHHIMQRNVVTIAAGEVLSTLEDIMTLGGVRHMPVVRGGELVGVVSERDLLRVSLSNLFSLRSHEKRAFLSGVEVTSVMSEPAVVIGADDSVERAAQVMAERKIGCLPVVDDNGQLAGLVTETDLLRHFAGAAGELPDRLRDQVAS
jgi:CBS domain-containing protein